MLNICVFLALFICWLGFGQPNKNLAFALICPMCLGKNRTNSYSISL